MVGFWVAGMKMAADYVISMLLMMNILSGQLPKLEQGGIQRAGEMSPWVRRRKWSD